MYFALVAKQDLCVSFYVPFSLYFLKLFSYYLQQEKCLVLDVRFGQMVSYQMLNFHLSCKNFFSQK